MSARILLWGWFCFYLLEQSQVTLIQNRIVSSWKSSCSSFNYRFVAGSFKCRVFCRPPSMRSLLDGTLVSRGTKISLSHTFHSCFRVKTSVVQNGKNFENERTSLVEKLKLQVRGKDVTEKQKSTTGYSAHLFIRCWQFGHLLSVRSFLDYFVYQNQFIA